MLDKSELCSTGIEPAYSAWEANVLPLNYVCVLYFYITFLEKRKEKTWNQSRLESYWWVLTGSNRRPSVRQTDALPAELNTQCGADYRN